VRVRRCMYTAQGSGFFAAETAPKTLNVKQG